LGCPNCFKKVTDNRLTGFFCNTCQKIVKEKHLYFIHALFEDFTGKILIGMSREPAQSLMIDMDAQTFMTTVKKGFESDNDFDTWLNTSIYYKRH
jgi:hypothetical protein